MWEILAFRAERKTGESRPLFGEDRPKLPSPEHYDRQIVLRQEVETLGMLLSCHPLELYREKIRQVKPVPARELRRWT